MQAEAGCKRLFAYCKGEGAFDNEVCADIFQLIDVDRFGRFYSILPHYT